MLGNDKGNVALEIGRGAFWEERYHVQMIFCHVVVYDLLKSASSESGVSRLFYPFMRFVKVSDQPNTATGSVACQILQNTASPHF